MRKFWALIATNRARVFALGKHEDEDKAFTFGEEYVARKNEENADKFVEIEGKKERAIPDYLLLAVFDENGLRTLIGDVHRPLVIASEKEGIAVESPKKRGGS